MEISKNIQKLNSILMTLGYDNGEMIDLQVSDDGSTCNISFKIKNVKCEVKNDDDLKDVHLPWKKPVISNISRNYISKPVEEPEKKDLSTVTFEEYCNENSKPVTYDPKKDKVIEKDEKKLNPRYVRDNPNWKTPTPRVVLRKVFFKSYDLAKKFANEYEKDFEKNDYAMTKSVYKPYNIIKNQIDNGMFKKGYGYLIEFRMNGKTFKILEEMEELKKIEGRKAGGCCLRYKA